MNGWCIRYGENDVLSDVSYVPKQIRQYNDPDLETEMELPPLDTVIAKDLLRKLKPKEKKRQEVINGTSCAALLYSNLFSTGQCRQYHHVQWKKSQDRSLLTRLTNENSHAVCKIIHTCFIG